MKGHCIRQIYLNPCVCISTERVVIHQTPHSEGEEHENHEEEELSSGSSRGSLQWVSGISHEHDYADKSKCCFCPEYKCRLDKLTNYKNNDHNTTLASVDVETSYCYFKLCILMCKPFNFR